MRWKSLKVAALSFKEDWKIFWVDAVKFTNNQMKAHKIASKKMGVEGLWINGITFDHWGTIAHNHFPQGTSVSSLLVGWDPIPVPTAGKVNYRGELLRLK